MNKTRFLVVVVFLGLVVAGCLGACDGEASLLETSHGSSDADPALRASNIAHWEVASLSDLDRLLESADGYAYYYVFETIPQGLKLQKALYPVAGTETVMIFAREQGDPVQLFAWVQQPGMEDMAQFEQIEVDGVVYHYNQSYDEETGAFSYSYFQWIEDGMLFLVHPQEPITPEVVRKYAGMRKVGFNEGQPHVGFGGDGPLVESEDKIQSILQDNPGIKYVAGGSTTLGGD